MAGVREARTAAYRAPEGPQGDRFPLRAFPCLRGGLRLVGGLPAFCLAGGGDGGLAARPSVWALSRFGETPICERQLFGILQGVLDFVRLRL